MEFVVTEISDRQVCEAYLHCDMLASEWPYDLLMRDSGHPMRFCVEAMSRAKRHGLIGSNASLRSGWLTEAGRALLASKPLSGPRITITPSKETPPSTRPAASC